jgi:hypothetical protein
MTNSSRATGHPRLATRRKRTLTDHNHGRIKSGCRVVRRRAGCLGLQPVARRPAAPSRGPCGGPIGVVKLLRARGGCLGVIRIRAWKAAKSPGELPNEHRSRNTRATQGTETSQYLEERKSTETPSVAASERGPAQTGRDTVRGCGAGVVEWTKPSRSPLENGTRAGDSPVGTGTVLLSGTQVGSGTGNPA